MEQANDEWASMREKLDAIFSTNYFTDERDGRKYRTVTIDGVKWMAENLNYETPASRCYDDDGDYSAKYGRLYTWEDAMSACPEGWHLPTREEWEGLARAVGGRLVICDVDGDSIRTWADASMSLKAKTGWVKNGTDDFNFSALPSGMLNVEGDAVEAGSNGYWWTATKKSDEESYYWSLRESFGGVLENSAPNGFFSPYFSVRCVEEVHQW